MHSLVVLVFTFGLISSSSSSENNLLLNICFQFGSCRSSEAWFKLTPANFDLNVYNYTIDIPSNYPFYTPTGFMLVNFYVIMNVSNTDYLNDGKQSVAKSILYDAAGKEVLASTDLAYSSNEMLLISAQLSFGTENEVDTELIVYQFNNGTVRQSDPYILTFKRNE